MQALGMTDGFFTVLLMGGCKAVRFLLDSKNCLLLPGYGENGKRAGFKSQYRKIFGFKFQYPDQLSDS